MLARRARGDLRLGPGPFHAARPLDVDPLEGPPGETRGEEVPRDERDRAGGEHRDPYSEVREPRLGEELREGGREVRRRLEGEPTSGRTAEKSPMRATHAASASAAAVTRAAAMSRCETGRAAQ